jgi:hypothetical protein
MASREIPASTYPHNCHPSVGNPMLCATTALRSGIGFDPGSPALPGLAFGRVASSVHTPRS